MLVEDPEFLKLWMAALNSRDGPGEVVRVQGKSVVQKYYPISRKVLQLNRTGYFTKPDS
jgi:hypothetical protein